jgi:bacterioferritin-associated ferredoxin
MIVCVCAGVSTSDIAAAVAGGACTLQQIQASTDACTCCQACEGCVLETINECSKVSHVPK